MSSRKLKQLRLTRRRKILCEMQDTYPFLFAICESKCSSITVDTNAWSTKLSEWQKTIRSERYDSNQIIWKCVKRFYMNEEQIDAFFARQIYNWNPFFPSQARHSLVFRFTPVLMFRSKTNSISVIILIFYSFFAETSTYTDETAFVLMSVLNEFLSIYFVRMLIIIYRWHCCFGHWFQPKSYTWKIRTWIKWEWAFLCSAERAILHFDYSLIHRILINE